MTRCSRVLAVSLVAGFSLGTSAVARGQPTVGHVDNFQDGTTQGWTVRLGPVQPPGAVLPQNVASGGPAGAGDRYLLLTALGGDPNSQDPQPSSRLTSINPGSAWTGNYLTSGVNAIRLQANNFGPDPLYLRLLFENPTFGPPTDVAVSATPWLLPAGSGWQSFIFPLYGPGGLVPLGTSSLSALLANVTAIRLYNAPTVADNGPPVVARLGVDNVTAAVIPEPSTVALLGSGLLVLLAGARRRRTEARRPG